MQSEEHRLALQGLHALLERRWRTTPLDAWSYSFCYLAGPIPFNCYVEINPDMNGVVFRAMLSQPVPQACRQTMADLCNAINYQVPMGCFAVHMESGDLRWKFGAYFGRSGPSEELIRSVVEPSAVFLDMYVLSIMAAWNGASLQDAMARMGEDPGIGKSDDCHYKDEPHPRASDHRSRGQVLDTA
jgi:hypothetical protein